MKKVTKDVQKEACFFRYNGLILMFEHFTSIFKIYTIIHWEHSL